MSKVAVFAIAFTALFAFTLAVPWLPPGDAISSFVEIPATTSILGISGVTLLNAVLNGFFWGIIVFIIYILGRRPSKREDYSPITAPAYPKAPVATPGQPKSLTMSRKPRERKVRPKVREKETYVPLDQDIETIEGIGHTYGNQLRNAGIKVIEDLLRAGATRNGRRYLAKKVGVAPGTLRKWVCRADFFRIRGIGTQYSALLESAGVNTVPSLSRLTPKNLYEKLRKTNREKKLVRRIPPLTKIQDWIKSAKTLKRLVEY
jgi:predicted flap endonuclease-1-like 5' DNA nuclease